MRIGLHVGEPIRAEDDYFGAGVTPSMLAVRAPQYMLLIATARAGPRLTATATTTRDDRGAIRTSCDRLIKRFTSKYLPRGEIGSCISL